MNTATAKKPDVKPGNGKSAEGRDRILAAAEALFIERGFEGVSVNDVAVRADVAKALVFYHFNSKRELFGAVLDRYYSGQAAALMSAVSGGGSIRDRVHAGVDAYFDFVLRNPGYPRLIQGEICSNSENLDKILEHMGPLHAWGDAVFGRILPSEGRLAAKHFFVSVFGMIAGYFTYMPVLSRLWDGDPLAPAAAAERREHVHFLLDTILEKFFDEKG